MKRPRLRSVFQRMTDADMAARQSGDVAQTLAVAKLHLEDAIEEAGSKNMAKVSRVLLEFAAHALRVAQHQLEGAAELN